VSARSAGAATIWLACAAAAWAAAAAAQDVSQPGNLASRLGRVAFEDPFSPPAYRALTAGEQTQVELGSAVFNTQWLPAGISGAGRRAGLGPLFNSGSCDSCHNSAKRARGPAGDGPAPAGLVLQLGTRGRDGRALPEGDPVYGRTLNTVALDGVAPEGRVAIRYQNVDGRYADGTPWNLRSPVYEVSSLRYGPLSEATLIKPRLAPQLFGVGLLQAAMTTAGARATAHFGWQGDVPSVREQTGKAFALEMGLTSSVYPHDDRTPAQQLGAGPSASSPEVAEELLNALVAFEETMAVPQVPAASPELAAHGSALFSKLGCAGCHTPQLPVPAGHIAAYTDLKLHDMGTDLADSTLAGLKVKSRWRTAPLWANGYRGHGRTSDTLLHDGRARSVEEAILWHGGEGRAAQARYEKLSGEERAALVRWVESL
jgi:CxxC motif-containing protein (DUF1111 family)